MNPNKKNKLKRIPQKIKHVSSRILFKPLVTSPDAQSEPIQESNYQAPAKETLDHVTPFAFEISKELLGVKLAKPWKRLLAIAIDLLIIAILTSTLGVGMAVVATLLFYKLKMENPKHDTPWLKKIGKALVLFFIFFTGLCIWALTDGQYNSKRINQGAKNIANGTVFTASLVKLSNCENQACRLQMVKQAAKAGHKMNFSADSVEGAIKDVLSEVTMNNDEKSKIELHLKDLTKDLKKEKHKEDQIDFKDWTNKNTAETAIDGSIEESPVGIIAWTKSILVDLGLSVGWAAIYFTILTAWWHGQTVGKRIVGIRVVSITNEPLSIWDSFGRYGGYGAGITTGLLGFIQIIWDPNRQAIQDKISETLVVDQRASH